MPISENGKSVEEKCLERTPFCPCLEANLSPVIGFLLLLILIKVLVRFVRLTQTADNLI